MLRFYSNLKALKKAAKVLIVDDEADILHLVTLSLLTNGYEIMKAKSKAELLPLLSDFKPDVLLLDVNLGTDNGREICKIIKAAEHRHIYVILMSALPDALQNAEECGANEVLEKPFSIPVLLEKIEKAVAGKVEG